MKGKSNIDINSIIKAVKSVIDTVQSSNKSNPNETTAPDSVFNSIYKKVEEAMKNTGSTTEKNTENDLGADNDFLNDVSFEKINPNQSEIDKVKASFKIEEEKLKASFEEQMNKLKLTFKEKHEALKKDFQSKIDALKENKA